jgi:hypothetical protein
MNANHPPTDTMTSQLSLNQENTGFIEFNFFSRCRLQHSIEIDHLLHRPFG